MDRQNEMGGGKSGRRKVVECAGIALVSRGSIFLIRPMFNGVVQQPGIPKGHVEPGESAQNAASREFREETGIDISGRPLEFLCYAYAKVDDDTDKKVIVFRVDGDGSERFKGSNLAENGEPENVDGGYVPYERALDTITVYQQPIVQKLMEQERAPAFKRFMKGFGWRPWG